MTSVEKQLPLVQNFFDTLKGFPIFVIQSKPRTNADEYFTCRNKLKPRHVS